GGSTCHSKVKRSVANSLSSLLRAKSSLQPSRSGTVKPEARRYLSASVPSGRARLQPASARRPAANEPPNPSLQPTVSPSAHLRLGSTPLTALRAVRRG